MDDVKSFLRSDFYEAVFDFLVSYLGGIVITDKDNEIIYKEFFAMNLVQRILKINILLFKQ